MTALPLYRPSKRLRFVAPAPVEDPEVRELFARAERARKLLALRPIVLALGVAAVVGLVLLLTR